VHLDVAALRGDVTDLCADVRERVDAARPAVVVCDVSALRTVDVGTLDALARLRLTVRRAGAELVLRGSAPSLCGLARLTGLDEAVGLARPGGRLAASGVERSGLELQGQAEGPEDVLPEEVRDAADPPVADLQDVDRPGHPPRPVGAGLVLGEGGRAVGGDPDHP
jgi:anti-anti-sigma regulatory factor